jgi:hypothetical protein
MSSFTRRVASRSALAVLLCGLVAACTTHPSNSTQGSGPALSPSGPPVSSLAASPAPASSSAPPPAILPAGCPQLLPLGVVEQALGSPLYGQVTYLRAAPVPQSGRTGRVTCGYGTSPTAPGVGPSPAPSATPSGEPLVEASYITYTDAKTAASRVALTVQTDGASSTVTKVSVGALPASVLLGPTWNELVMADGARTIVVEASPKALPNANAATALISMATVMLKFGAAPSSSAAASTSANS